MSSICLIWDYAVDAARIQPDSCRLAAVQQYNSDQASVLSGYRVLKKMSKRSFHNKVSVISGAAGGIGTELCRGILAQGGTVIALDLDEAGLKALPAKLSTDGSLEQPPQSNPSRLHCYRIDLTNYARVQALYKKIKSRHPRIDYLFNNAGLVHRSSFLKTDVRVFRKVMDVNLWASVHLSKVFLPDLIESKGAIAITSSVAGFAPLYGRSFYCASKFALQGAFESIRSEVQHLGVDVCIISPGFTKTRFEQAALGVDGKRVTHARSTVGQYDTPEHVATEILAAVRRRRSFTVLSPIGQISWFLRRFCPACYSYLMRRTLASELNQE
ncbi:MAG: SDR family NAD(P)-dependent oxidoreductase [Leptospiraceae bacterium]|nr:SDR family NAD(P)-dependent oxidoreductase [Leptospiraceae bacterium]